MSEIKQVDERGVIRFSEKVTDLKPSDSEKLALLVVALVYAGKRAAREYEAAKREVALSPLHAGRCMGAYEAYRKVLEALGEGHRLPESIEACAGERVADVYQG